MSGLDDVLREFLVESHENLDQLDRDLVELEQSPGDRQRLASVFRTIHTIKGTCGFFGLSKLESVSHVGENLLSRLRDGELELTPGRTSALLAMVDAIREMLAAIERTGTDGDGDYTALAETLTRLQAREAEPGPGPEAAEPEPEAPAGKMGEIFVQTGLARPHEVDEALGRQAGGDPRHLGEILVEEGVVKPQDVAAALAGQRETRSQSVSETCIRVDVGLLDKLMNLVGELVLARNQILQFTSSLSDTALLNTSQRLNLITTELQEGVMKTRMQPIGNIWNQFPRIVRDLSVQCGKQVRVEMEGKETELDKTIIEAIKDPLTHIVRNAIDHGVEPAADRLAAGKPAEGRLFLRAFHEGGQVNIEISDDGAGVDPGRVKARAVEKGLVTREHAAQMTERECWNLIFLPGFSTAAKVTNLSGRGVGMDVVKTNIERIGGAVDVHSRPGRGTTLKIKIPLTLAIIPALIVKSGGDRYAIPQVSLLELVRLEGAEARQGVEMVHGSPVYRLRGNLLPLVHLNRELGVDGGAGAAAGRGAGPEPAAEAEAVNIVVLQADGRQFGLVVEEINDTEEIVVKPLGKHLKGIPLFAGATIMGDGRVALILDILGIAQRAGVVAAARDRRPAAGGRREAGADEPRQTLLLFGLGGGRRLAMPLSMVARLEEIPANAVESADGREVVQYRGDILPLLRLADHLGGAGGPPAELLQVIVYAEGGRAIGLVVDRIYDTAEAALRVRQKGRRPGVLGSAVIGGAVTDVLDIRELVRAAGPDLLPSDLAVSGG